MVILNMAKSTQDLHIHEWSTECAVTISARLQLHSSSLCCRAVHGTIMLCLAVTMAHWPLHALA